MFQINSDWSQILKEEFQKNYYLELMTFLENEYANKTIFPSKENVFNALNLTSYKNTKVLILGQDPYHEPGQAQGLAFSVNKNVKIPPSLKNIYKEMQNDINTYIPNNGDLTSFAKQGILLLNTVLTVEKGKANSHKGKGWENFTDNIIRSLNKKDEPVVFILWGNNARSKAKFINNKKHLVIESAHPSPLSAYNGFFNSKPFSKTNDFLIKNHLKSIDWQIENV